MQIENVSSDNQVLAVARLAREIWVEHFTPIIGRPQVDYMLEKFQSASAIAAQVNMGYRYFLLKDDSGHAGYTGVLPEHDRLFLSKLYIVRAYRRKGYGRETVAFLGELALKNGLDNIYLTVNKYNSGAIRAYQRMGFENAGSVVQDIGNGFVMDDYRMEKRL